MIGLRTTYVDDMLHAENNEYIDLTKKTEQAFQCSKPAWDCTVFSRMEIEQFLIAEDAFRLHQKRYIMKIEPIPLKSNFTDSRYLLAKLALIQHSRPDIVSCFYYSQINGKKVPGKC